MLSISNSEIQQWKSCRRSWYVNYYLKKQPARVNPVGATQLGTRVHAALEGYYDPALKVDPTVTIRNIYNLDCEAYPEYEDQLRTEELLADSMVSGYMDWLEETGLDIGLYVLSVEDSIEIPFEQEKLGDVYLRGRLDMRVRTMHGSVQFMDHKTCQTFLTADYLDRDEQAKFYMMLERLSGSGDGLWCQGGIFNMLRKSKRSATAKPPFYRREYVDFNNDVLNSMYYRTFAVVQDIVEARSKLADGTHHNLVVYPSPGKDCSWKCPLAAAGCSMMDDGSDWEQYLEEEFVTVDPYLRYHETSYLDKLDQSGKL